MIFQDDRLFPHLSVAANIRFGLKGWRRGEADARLAEVAALCGVERLMDRSPENALRRRAAAGRPGAGAGAPPPALALRRAGLGARPGQPPRDGASAPRRPARAGDPDALRHAQRRRGRRPGLAAVPAGAREDRRRGPAAGRPGRGAASGRRLDPVRRRAQRLLRPRRGPRPRAQRHPTPPRRRPRADRRRSSTGRRAARSWSRSAPTTSCCRGIPSPAFPPATRSRARRADRLPRPRGRGRHPHRADSPGSSAWSPRPSSSSSCVPGSEVHMIVKARSCHVIDDDYPDSATPMRPRLALESRLTGGPSVTTIKPNLKNQISSGTGFLRRKEGEDGATAGQGADGA